MMPAPTISALGEIVGGQHYRGAQQRQGLLHLAVLQVEVAQHAQELALIGSQGQNPGSGAQAPSRVFR
jgi:hypothetical protein